jgi:hypothetical protein
MDGGYFIGMKQLMQVTGLRAAGTVKRQQCHCSDPSRKTFSTPCRHPGYHSPTRAGVVRNPFTGQSK